MWKFKKKSIAGTYLISCTLVFTFSASAIALPSSGPRSLFRRLHDNQKLDKKVTWKE
jgi:hypothetical protein